jgi:monoamine oxidase
LDSFNWLDGAFALRIGEQTVRAASLILAMPRRSLDLLAPMSPPLQQIQEITASVTPRPLFKLFTTYSSPWWRAAGYTKRSGQARAVSPLT